MIVLCVKLYIIEVVINKFSFVEQIQIMSYNNIYIKLIIEFLLMCHHPELNMNK